MTLLEAADQGGIDVDRLKELLGLPGDIPADGRIGRLGRRYGFALSKVRDLLEEHAQASLGG